MSIEKNGPISLPLLLSDGTTHVFRLFLYVADGGNYHVLMTGEPGAADAPLVRIESACTYAHIYGSRLCDCATQLAEALRLIADEGVGVVVYALDQHGRGIGLQDHLRVYKAEQDWNLDTVEAHQALGLPVDARNYGDELAILADLGLKHIRLLTNSTRRLAAINASGVVEAERIALELPLNTYSARELMVKKQRMGHLYSFKSDQEWVDEMEREERLSQGSDQTAENSEKIFVVRDFTHVVVRTAGAPFVEHAHTAGVIRQLAQDSAAISVYWGCSGDGAAGIAETFALDVLSVDAPVRWILFGGITKDQANRLRERLPANVTEVTVVLGAGSAEQG